MTNSKHVLAVGLASLLWFFVVVGGPAVQRAGLAMAFVISAIALATAAFFVSWKQRSFPVAGLLATGVILMTPGLITIGYLSVIVFRVPSTGSSSG